MTSKVRDEKPIGRRSGRMLALYLAVACLLAGSASAQEILPFSEVKPGMKGVGRTVFSGTQIEEFEVEVLGKLENIAARRNLILVRLSGGPLATTGVLSGMSGSPIYLGGRLAGAVAYTWGFAKEPIAGVTPIQEMLAIEDKENPSLPARTRNALPPEAGPAGLDFLRDPSMIPAHFSGYFDRLAGHFGGSGQLSPIRTPLLFSGLPASTVDTLGRSLRSVGLLAVQGGGSGKGKGEGESAIVPGAGVGLKLVRGDIEVAAICTVTHRDRSRVLACGHPLFNLGPTDLVMTTATVNALFPSLHESFKFASAGEEVGAFRQDRATGVFGYLGKRPSMIPVRVELRPSKGRSLRYSFDIVEDSFLAPYLLYAALNGMLANEEKGLGSVSISYEEGSTIRVAGENDIMLNNLFAGDLATQYASGIIAFIVQLMMNNEYQPVRVEGINLILGYSDERRTARIQRAWLSRDRVKAGDSVQAYVSIRPFRGPEVIRAIDLEIPDEVAPGRLLLQIGDGLALARAEREEEEFVPRDLSHLIWLINHLRRNDTVYAVLTRADNGVMFQGLRLPNLPPSKAQVIVRPRTKGNFQRLLYRLVAEESLRTDYMMTGFKLLSIDVEE